MRRLIDAPRMFALLRAFGEAAREPGRVYFTGGVTALLLGWRESTVDVDLRLEAGAETLLREVPRIKEAFEVNVELASPPDFVPELPGWRERCLFIVREGPLDFFHFDPYSQVLAKLERAHDLDRRDVARFV